MNEMRARQSRPFGERKQNTKTREKEKKENQTTDRTKIKIEPQGR